MTPRHYVINYVLQCRFILIFSNSLIMPPLDSKLLFAQIEYVFKIRVWLSITDFGKELTTVLKVQKKNCVLLPSRLKGQKAFWTFRLLDIRVVGHSFFRPFSAFFLSRRQAHFLLQNRHSLKIIFFVLLSCGICKLNSSFKLQHICLEFLTGGTCGNVGLQIVFSYQLIYVWTQVTFLV